MQHNEPRDIALLDVPPRRQSNESSPEPRRDSGTTSVPRSTAGGRSWTIVVGAFVAITLVGVTLSIVTKPDTTKKVVNTNIEVPPRGPNSVVYDTFARPDTIASLGKAVSGQKWAVVGAPWSIEAGLARVAQSDAGKRTVAVTDLAASDGTVQVTMLHAVGGAGVLFRYRDVFNYWALTAAPKYGTWNLQKAVGGVVTTVGNIGLVGTDDGTTVGIRFEGPRISIVVKGRVARSFNDRDLMTATHVGLVGNANATLETRWDNFVGSVLGTAPSAITPGAASSSSSTGSG